MSGKLFFADEGLGEPIAALRAQEYAGASGFTLDLSTLRWSESDASSLVMVAADAGQLVSTMRGELIEDVGALEWKLECPWSFPTPLEFPVLLLSRAATLASYRQRGLNLLMRYHFLELAAQQGIRFVVGTFVSGSPRENTLREMGYQLFENPAGWQQSSYRAQRPVWVALLDLARDGDRALDHCRRRIPEAIAAFPLEGALPSPLRRGSYQFERLEERQREASFLAERAHLRLEGFGDLLKRHGFPESGRALEVGCGQGIRTTRMAQASSRVEVLGVDRSAELLAQARAIQQRPRNLSFEQGDLYELPYPDDTFDFIYARLVFMHLSRPLQALRALRRVLRPGGRLLIEDADRDCMFFEPEPASFRPFWTRVQQAQRRHGGDPNVGRRLAPLLKESGFVSPNVEVQPIVGGGEQIRFLARTLMPSLNQYVDPADRPEGERAIEDLTQLASDPRATFYHFWFAVSAAKPVP